MQTKLGQRAEVTGGHQFWVGAYTKTENDGKVFSQIAKKVNLNMHRLQINDHAFIGFLSSTATQVSFETPIRQVSSRENSFTQGARA